MTVDSLANGDGRSAVINVAGPAALLVAKAPQASGERVDTHDRLNDKDAHGIYRLLVATQRLLMLAKTMQRLHADEVSQGTTTRALGYLEQLFASADALGATMARKSRRAGSASQTRSRLRSASSHRTYSQPWRDQRGAPGSEPRGLTP